MDECAWCQWVFGCSSILVILTNVDNVKYFVLHITMK